MANNRRPQMDYYEYKRRYEAARLARGGQAPQPPQAPEPEPEEKAKGRGLLGGLKQAVSGFGGRSGEVEEETLVQDQAPAAAIPSRQRPSQEAPSQEAAPQEELPQAVDLPPQHTHAVQDEMEDELPLEDEELNEDARQIDTPFADAAAVLKRLGGTVAGLGAKLKQARSRREKDARHGAESDGAESAALSVDVGLAVNPEPEAASQDAQQPLPEKEPMTAASAPSHTQADQAPADIPDDRADQAPADIPDDRADQVPADIPDDRADQAPADIPDDRADQAPADIPDDRADQAPADIPDDRADQAPADIPDDRADQAPADIPDDRADQAPADIPVPKEAHLEASAPDSQQLDEEDEEDEAVEKRPKRFSFWPKGLKHAGRKEKPAQDEPEEAPSEAQPQEPQEEEPAEKAPHRHKFLSLLGSPSRTSANQDGDDEDDEDIAPSGGGIRLFSRSGGRAKAPIKAVKGRALPPEEPEEEADEDMEPQDLTPAAEPKKDVFALAAEEEQLALKGTLTQELAQDLDQEEDTLSRRARRAAQVSRKERRVKAVHAPVQEPEDEGEDEDQEPPVDEPTQAFRPLRHAYQEDGQRTRRFQPVRKSHGTEPALDEDDEDYDDYDDYDEDDDLPVRGYARRRRGGLRVYQDDDLEDEDAGYDDYDDYEESPYEDDYDDDGYEEDRLSFGKRVLRFLRVVLVLALVLLVAVLALRQLEANGVISLNLLRNSIGVLVPLDKVFPTPLPEAEPQVPDALATVQPQQSLQPSTISGQVSVSPTSSPADTPQPTQTALEEPAATQAPVGVPLEETPRASAQFLDEELPEAVG